MPLDVVLAAGLTFLVMRQVMPMAAGLASGLALSTFGVVSRFVALGSAPRVAAGSARSRWRSRCARGASTAGLAACRRRAQHWAAA